ncbi:MAG: hypothetical protein IH831_02565 [Planctomycetes bacterium]|nr:hypothetical protein [Planctomycetota bacterium]
MRFKQPGISRLLVLVTGLFLQSPQAHAITAGQIDDFQDGTTQSWTGSPTTNASDSGPNGMGDHALSVPSSGGGGPGSRLVTFNNSSAWTGDWTANGVTQIQLDVFNPNAFEFTMRLGIAGPGDFGSFGQGNKYVTSTGIVVPTDSQWHTVLFDVTAADLAQISGTDAADALTGVTQFRVIHNSASDWRGEAVAGTFLLDNITAIPEPATATLGLGSLAMALLTRRERRH